MNSYATLNIYSFKVVFHSLRIISLRIWSVSVYIDTCRRSVYSWRFTQLNSTLTPFNAFRWKTLVQNKYVDNASIKSSQWIITSSCKLLIENIRFCQLKRSWIIIYDYKYSYIWIKYHKIGLTEAAVHFY